MQAIQFVPEFVEEEGNNNLYQNFSIAYVKDEGNFAQSNRPKGACGCSILRSAVMSRGQSSGSGPFIT